LPENLPDSLQEIYCDYESLSSIPDCFQISYCCENDEDNFLKRV
jgi:hypothetical protein